MSIYSHSNTNLSKVWFIIALFVIAVGFIGQYTYASLKEISDNSNYVMNMDVMSIRDIRAQATQE